ncbi:MAG: DNA/RNA nuclease SfsA, partial [Aquificaceae bacterium]
PELIKANFIQRLNRFVGLISLEDKELTAYIRNTGRLRELLFSGNEVYVAEKTIGRHPFEIILAKRGDYLVCIDSHIAPKLYVEWVSSPAIFEPRFGNKRFDLLINGRPIEVKSVNLVENNTALFPDAPTLRGKQHIEKLIELSKEGYNPLIVFVVQRGDAEVFSPNWRVDPEFSKALLRYFQLGLEIRAYRCSVSLEEIKLKEEIPVEVLP